MWCDMTHRSALLCALLHILEDLPKLKRKTKKQKTKKQKTKNKKRKTTKYL